jgi:hypothetical protein
MHNITLEIIPHRFGDAWEVRIPSPKARKACATGPYGEDSPIADDVEAYLPTWKLRESLHAALGEVRGEKTMMKLESYQIRYVRMYIDDAATIWRWNL